MPGGGGTDVAQDEKVHEDGEIVNGEVSGSHCVISFWFMYIVGVFLHFYLCVSENP